MRRLTLGALILGGGTLLSLPFRRPDVPDPASIRDGVDQKKVDVLDDHSLEMLVREVTQDVQVPSVYHPHTDYAPAASSLQTRTQPLTYEDLAVPVDRDPIHEKNFNASADVVAHNAAQARRIAGLERAFAEAEFVDQSIAHLNSGPPPANAIPGLAPPADVAGSLAEGPIKGWGGTNPWTTDAQLASSEFSGRNVADADNRSQSVLSQLPPPAEIADSPDRQRQRHWIRQPD